MQWPNPNTNEKIIKVDNRTNTYEVAKRLWAFANWSRYVRPGAVRVSTAGAPSGLRTAAFRNVDGSVAVIAISSSGSAINASIRLAGVTPAAVVAYASDNSRNCQQTASTLAADGTISGSVASRSITTFFIIPAEASGGGGAT